jgi:hypothetical protein
MTPQLKTYSKACLFITKFVRRRFDSARLLVKQTNAAKLVQKYLKGYLVCRTIRFVKLDKNVNRDLGDLLDTVSHIKNVA